jgi:hypothetical protein
METMNNVRVIFQRQDGLYPVDDALLTEEELRKLMTLMPGGWIIIRWHSPQDFRDVKTSPDLIKYERLTDATLRKIAERRPLDEDGFQDIVKSCQ